MENEEELKVSKNVNKNDWRWALKGENVAIEWKKYAPSINLQSIWFVAGRKQKCSLSIAECDAVQRLIFIMKYYSFWMKFKTETTTKCFEIEQQEKNENGLSSEDLSEYAESTTELIGSLRAYNRSKLLRDYLHCRHYHFNDDSMIAEFHRSQIPDCNDKNKVCRCIHRNHQNKEIYINTDYKKNYWIQNMQHLQT